MNTPLRLIALSFMLVAQSPAQSSLFGIKLEGGGAQPKTLLVFGDSLSSSDALPKDKQAGVWPGLLETQAQGWLSVINESKPARSTSAVTDLDAVLKKKRATPPDLIVIMLGTEDTRDPSPQCVSRAVNNLRALVAATRRKLGPQFPVLLIAPPNLRKSDLPPGAATPDQREASLKALASAIAKLAQETKCAFTTAQGVIPEEHFTKGGLLPDENGHIALANALLPAILRAAGFQENAK